MTRHHAGTFSFGLALVLGAGTAHASWELREAARAGDAPRVQRALGRGDDPSGDSNEPSPLMEAAMGGHVVVMEVLEAAHADLERADHNGDRALHWAVDFQQSAAVGWLLAHGAKVDARGHGGRTPLLAAVAKGDLALTDRLLKAGADARAVDDTGWGAAYMATIWAGEAVLARVLAAGADPNFPRPEVDPETALIAAATRDEAGKVRLLLAHGADPKGRPAAWLAAARRGARLAMDTLADAAPRTAEALVWAAQVGDTATVERCLAAGVGLEAADRGMTALTAAAAGGQGALVELLVGRGATREPPGIASALELAANDAIATRLLAGAPLQATTLHAAFVAAAGQGDLGRTKLLAAAGARAGDGDGALGRAALAALDDHIAALAARLATAQAYRGIPGWVRPAQDEKARLEAVRPAFDAFLGALR